MSSDSDSSDDYYGPALPPGFKQNSASESEATEKNEQTPSEKKSEAQIGPVLPPELKAKLEENVSAEDNDLEQTSAKSGTDSDSDDDVIGPLPPDHPKAHLQGSGPSASSNSSDKKPKREEWMLVPPKNKIIPGLGLGPRKFLTRTPQDSKKSDDEEDDEEAFAREAEAAIEKKMIDEYDQKMEEMKKDFEAKKRRGESLLQIHQKEMKMKKTSTDEKTERKPFDRDADLKITGLSGEDKQKYIEKSKELNSKFSRGSRKYL